MNETKYIKIILLTLNEMPVKYMEGYITSGSINIDGNSAIRRTCNLSCTILNEKIIEALDIDWALYSKIKIEISEDNEQWINQGIYVLTSFSKSTAVNGTTTVNLSGKDKMCLLNGEVGGTLTAITNFGLFDEVDSDGNTTSHHRTIEEILYSSINVYGGEQLQNIIIKDLPTRGLELQTYRYKNPLFLWRPKEGTKDYINGTMDETLPIYVNQKKTSIGNVSYISLTPQSPLLNYETQSDATTFTFKPKSSYTYEALKINYGQTCGYIETELIYPGDLIGKSGEALTAILDKIKNVLGDYEYFYNVDGQFVFQMKKTYINSSWVPVNADDIYVDALDEPEMHVFSNADTFTTITHNPQLNNVKNDFVVWGTRKSITGQELPVHMRYAIDTKPIEYTTIEVSNEEVQSYNKKYNVNLSGQNSMTYSIEEYDWREIIYRMALDYNRYNHLNTFLQKVAQANRESNLYQDGITGYEKYYTDLLGFWPDLYDTEKKKINNIEQPELLDFWLDFLDGGELDNFSIQKIGHRPKVVNDNDVKAIAYSSTPQIIFGPRPTGNEEDTAYVYLNLGNMEDFMTISTQGKSAIDAVDQLLYQHSYYCDSISITTLPIYDLKPNTRIRIADIQKGIEGNYVINRITLPLTYNGMMTISASRIADRIL